MDVWVSEIYTKPYSQNVELFYVFYIALIILSI